MATQDQQHSIDQTAAVVPLTVTASAARRIARIIAEEPAGTALRVAVNGGGCQGFSYEFDITRERRDDDVAIERDGVTVLVDGTSLELLSGSELDFIDSLIGQSFQIKNPQATSTCGCGTSFSI
jgi:iron-sulfur cluster assembly accessory protein